MKYTRRFGAAVGVLSFLSLGVYACVGDEAPVGNDFGADSGAGTDTGVNVIDGTTGNQDTGVVTPTDSGGGGTDSAGLCEAGAMICSGVCVDTTSSAATCGSCTHSCGTGATCTNSICQPVLLEGNPDGGGAPIATLTTEQGDDNPPSAAAHIVWSASGTGGGVFEDNTAGGNLIQLSTTTAATKSIVVHGGTVYWIGFNPGGAPQPIYQATLGGAASQTTLGTMNATGLVAIMYDSADSLIVGSYGAFGIFKCTTTAPATCSSEVTYTGTPSLNVATDGTSLFMADQAAGFFVQATLPGSNSSSFPLAAATPTLLRVGGTGATGYLYWANSGTQTLWRSTLNVSGQKQIASSANADGIAVDAVNIYWTDPTTGTVNYAPIGGGGSTTVYATLGASSNPMRMVRDKSSLYFIHNTAIYRLALP